VLNAAFTAGEISKRYLAVVRGWPPADFEVDHPLTRIEDPYAGPAGSAPAQTARTQVSRVATAELAVRVDRYPSSRYALVAACPLTGRRHQLRRHLRHANHPIIGDTTYGQGRHNRLFRERFGIHRLLLAAVSMTLRHPRSGAPLTLSAPPAADFLAATRALGWEDAAVLAAAAGQPIP
jgi:tRNA pseudouridine65 synthase